MTSDHAAARAPAASIFLATFTFRPGDYDDDFHRLDQRIAEAARGLPGYLGEETWENPASGQVSNTYYWSSREALEALIHHPDHREAKRQQARWLRGYQVVIAEVLDSYGDGGIAHPLGEIGRDPEPAGATAPDPGVDPGWSPLPGKVG